jgi:hypothetical protein
MEIKAKEREMKNGFLLTVSDESGTQPTQNSDIHTDTNTNLKKTKS